MKRGNILKKLRNVLLACKKVVIAFSGGVDSTFLLKTARTVLGKENVLAVIAASATYPAEELKFAVNFCKKNDIRFKVIKTCEFKNPNFTSNPKERCYYCKKELFARLLTIAKKAGIKYVLDGSNKDDLLDFRPGRAAKKEYGIKSPLEEAGLAKEMIRKLSKQLKLPTWNKPAMACLSSRIPYGTKIDLATVKKIEQGEKILQHYGFRQVRLRHHRELARIEVEPQEIKQIVKFKKQISAALKKIGYRFVTVDLDGYRTGSLNIGSSQHSPH